MATWTPLFAVGATVSLKAGGPVMTVHLAPDGPAKSYTCQWFAGKKLDRGLFKVEELLPAAPKAPLPIQTEETKS
jgi:uncharacterized protein YodC (DUF2158 family)